jgi:hypothetical protein
MDGRAVAITALAGIATGLLFLSMIRGGGLLPVAGYVVQLPILLCGLGLGPLSAALASAGALGTTLLASGLVAAVVLLVVQLAPALLLTRRALLWRAEGERVEWYPLGRLAADLALYVGAVSLAALVWLETVGAGTETLARLLAAHLAEGLGGPAAAPALEGWLARWLVWLPGIVALSWLAMIWTNAALAQALLARSGLARRPSPALADLALPGWVVPVTRGAFLGGSLLSGGPAFAARIVLLLGGALLFLAGLAVLHALVAKRRLGRAPLFLLYLLLLLFSWPLVPVVAALGLAEELVGLRRRLA